MAMRCYIVRPFSTLIIYLISSTLIADEEIDTSSSWRPELSNVYLWYASYGSNMWKSRLSCYIAGGQVMQHAFLHCATYLNNNGVPGFENSLLLCLRNLVLSLFMLIQLAYNIDSDYALFSVFPSLKLRDSFFFYCKYKFKCLWRSYKKGKVPSRHIHTRRKNLDKETNL